MSDAQDVEKGNQLLSASEGSSAPRIEADVERHLNEIFFLYKANR